MELYRHGLSIAELHRQFNRDAVARGDRRVAQRVFFRVAAGAGTSQRISDWIRTRMEELAA